MIQALTGESEGGGRAREIVMHYESLILCRTLRRVSFQCCPHSFPFRLGKFSIPLCNQFPKRTQSNQGRQAVEVYSLQRNALFLFSQKVKKYSPMIHILRCGRTKKDFQRAVKAAGERNGKVKCISQRINCSSTLCSFTRCASVCV